MPRHELEWHKFKKKSEKWRQIDIWMVKCTWGGGCDWIEYILGWKKRIIFKPQNGMQILRPARNHVNPPPSKCSMQVGTTWPPHVWRQGFYTVSTFLYFFGFVGNFNFRRGDSALVARMACQWRGLPGRKGKVGNVEKMGPVGPMII